MNDDSIGCLVYSILMILALLFILGSWIVSSAMEANAFNKVTGKNISTWDAMWIELRIQESTND